MVTTKRHQPPPSTLDPIADLEAAIMQAQEDTWRHHAVLLDERERLRPAVAKIAKAAADQLRAEHTSRTHR